MSTVAEEPLLRTWRYFFVVMACAVIATVFVGFRADFLSARILRPDSYHVGAAARPRHRVQRMGESLSRPDAVDRARSRRLHQWFGWVGSGIAAAMIILVTAAVMEQLRRVNGFPPPPLALALSAFDIIVFAGLVGAALYYRRRSDWHKRFMLSATIVLLGAPMFRVVVQAHRLGRYGESLDRFHAAGGCFFPAMLCLRPADPSQNPSGLPGRYRADRSGSGRTGGRRVLETVDRFFTGAAAAGHVTQTPSRGRGRCESSSCRTIAGCATPRLSPCRQHRPRSRHSCVRHPPSPCRSLRPSPCWSRHSRRPSQ